MKKRSDNSLATVLLVSRLLDEGVMPLKASEYRKLCSRFGEPASFIGQPVAGLVNRGIDPSMADRVARLLERAVGIAFELNRYEESGIWTLTEHDNTYPKHLRKRLGSKAPVMLHGSGSRTIFGQPGVGVVGSRAVSEEGATVARNAAARSAALGIPLVSGGARGVDQLAMSASNEAGGLVVGVLADSLTKTTSRADVRKALMDESTVMCTPYGPAAGFTVGKAMGRNKVIYGLATVTLVVSSELGSGGTWAGAVEALGKGFGRVAVWSGPGGGPGNAELIKRGGIAVGDIEQLDDIISQPEPPVEKPPEVSQQSLFFNALSED